MSAPIRGTGAMIQYMAPVQDRAKWMATLKEIRALPENRSRGRRFF